MKRKQILKQIKKQFKTLKLSNKIQLKEIKSKGMAFINKFFQNMENITNINLLVLNGVMVFKVVFQVCKTQYAWSVEI